MTQAEVQALKKIRNEREILDNLYADNCEEGTTNDYYVISRQLEQWRLAIAAYENTYGPYVIGYELPI